MLAAAKAFSASSVAVTDVRPTNLPVALTLGAHPPLDLPHCHCLLPYSFVSSSPECEV